MSIRITGMYSGLDTESIISELVSAQSVKKNSLMKAQTKLSWKQDAWKALNTKIFDFYTNTLSDLRYQGTYMKKTTKVSNENAISVITGADAVNGVRSVQVNKLAKNASLISGSLAQGNTRFTGKATLQQLGYTGGEGSINVVGANGASFAIQVNENTTIDEFVEKIQSTGLKANYDRNSQRIFIDSAGTGDRCDFNLVANNSDGLNVLATLGLLSVEDLQSEENKTWFKYSDGSGGYTTAFDDAVTAEIEARAKAYKEQNEKLTESNDKLTEANQKLFDEMDASDSIASGFTGTYGSNLESLAHTLYDDGGLYDQMADAKAAYEAKVKDNASQSDIDAAKADYENKQETYNNAKKEAIDYLSVLYYGPFTEKKDKDGNTVYEQAKNDDGSLKYEQAKNDDGSPKYEQAKNDDGSLKFESDGTTPVYDTTKPVYDKTKPVYDTTKPVMVHAGGGLEDDWKDEQKAGGVSDELKAKIDSLNKWSSDFAAIEKNKAELAANNARIEENSKYIDTNGDATAALQTDVRTEFEAKVDAAVETAGILADLEKLKANPEDGSVSENSLARKISGTKQKAADAEIELNGATFTSTSNSFNINGLTLTVMEETDKPVTLTTTDDTDGIYDMIKNFLTEYNKLINEMDSLYNAESSKGYEPLTTEEKDALSDSEVEEWEKKIKDSLLRRDATLSSVSFAMVSAMMQGVSVNGKTMHLSDFGINTLGYFKSADNEKHAYHIDGDPDDASVKANDDKLKAMIASNPETVTEFFTGLSNKLYDSLTEKMASSTLSSAFTVYNDKQMKSEYDSYKDKITAQEDKLNKMMDKWYKKFSAMEVAMSKLESRSSSLTSLFGG